MRAIVNTGANRLEMRELPLPEPADGQVRIRTAACGVCATDLQMIAGWERTAFGAIPGHEWSGTVDAVGEAVDASLVGRQCVGENVRAGGGEVGFEHPGGYAECFLTEAALVRTLPEGFDLVAATLIEPLAVCVRGLTRLGTPVEPILVFGDGPVGLIATMLLADGGVRAITIVGGREARLRLALASGAAVTVNYHDAGADLPEAVRRAAGEPAFQVVVEASGSPAALDAGVALAGADARVLVLGDYGEGRARFEWNTLLHKELRVIGSCASAGAWDDAVALATSGRIPLARLVSHVVPAERFADAIELTRSGRDATVKVVLRWR